MARNQVGRYPTPTREDEFGIEWAIGLGWHSLRLNEVTHDQEFADHIFGAQRLKFMRLRRDLGEGDEPEMLEEMLVVGCQEARADKTPTRFTVPEGAHAEFKALAVFCRYNAETSQSQWKPEFCIPVFMDTDVFYPEQKYRVVFVPKEQFERFGLSANGPARSFSSRLNFESLGGNENN